MNKTAQFVDIPSSLTQNLSMSPEESLQFISFNNSEERITHKTIIKKPIQHFALHKKDSFLINGWNQPNTRENGYTKRTDKSRSHFGLNTITNQQNCKSKQFTHRSLEARPNSSLQETNFNVRTVSKQRRRSKTSLVSYSPPPKEQFYNVQKLNIIKFYQNQRQKRLLMNDNLLISAEVGVIEYPIIGVNTRSNRLTNKKKSELYKRYFS